MRKQRSRLPLTLDTARDRVGSTAKKICAQLSFLGAPHGCDGACNACYTFAMKEIEQNFMAFK